MTDRRLAERAGNGLALAATPVFAAMGVITALHGGGPEAHLCSAGRDAWPLDGMTIMYFLMGIFHAPLWLRLSADRSARPRPAPTASADEE